MPEKWILKQYQSLPLKAKVLMTKTRIREWYNYWNGDVYVSFSGGKDSTVLAHLVHELYPEVPLVFSNTGLEYPEIQMFAKSMNAEFIRPKAKFSEVISKYGYPIISKENADVIYGARLIKNGSKKQRGNLGIPKSNKDGIWMNWRRKALHGLPPFDKGMFEKMKYLPLARDTQFCISHHCCNVIKKRPLEVYQKQTGLLPYIGTLANESRLREQAWIKNGCNAFTCAHKTSQPMSFWLEQDVLQYIKENDIEICSVYGDIVETENGLKCSNCDRTGCIFCAFGVHNEKGETRFQKLAKTHPRQYEYCMGGGQWVDNPNYDPAAPKYDDFWLNWNPKKIWVPSKEGLGMKFVFDECNQLYGPDFIRYE